MKKNKLIVGILGGIGSGKSTVAAEFAKLGCAVINADKIAHELLLDEDVKRQLIDAFGEGIFGKNGLISHAKLADTIFSSDKNVARINDIIHPLVFDRTNNLIEQYKRQEKAQLIVLDAPLLVEAGRAQMCDKLVFIDCDPKIRAQRAEKKGLGGEKHLKKREKFQISLDTKAKLAHYTIYNNSGLSDLADQVACIFSTLTR
ncbi:MAG: dephospho-CoA kinase [Planctomycetes bacterium]|nr:dephospho-CoA kinase [Planctomycetota bacterium]